MARDFHKGTLRMKNLLMTRTMSMNEAKLNRYDFYAVKYGRVSASKTRDLHSLWEKDHDFLLCCIKKKALGEYDESKGSVNLTLDNFPLKFQTFHQSNNNNNSGAHYSFAFIADKSSYCDGFLWNFLSYSWTNFYNWPLAWTFLAKYCSQF